MSYSQLDIATSINETKQTILNFNFKLYNDKAT